MSQKNRNQVLLDFLKRRHPLYDCMAAHWEFLADTYEGGVAWFPKNIFRYIKEGQKEFDDRVGRAYRFNHTREVVDLTIKYLFKMDASRSQDVPKIVKDFWASATQTGQSIRDFMRTVATEASVNGRTWIVVDSTKTAPTQNQAQDRELGARVYAYLVNPLNMLDLGYAPDGSLSWALVHEVERDDGDPILSSGQMQSRYRLWTKTFSQLFRIEKKKGSSDGRVIEEAPVPHDLGVVPIINADNVLSDEKYTSPALITDVAYLDRAVANYLSNLDAIIQDQTFSQLAMPSQGLAPGEDAYEKLLEMGTKRIFVYDGGEGGSMPHYLSPDVKQAQLILQVVNKIINEIYHSVGLAGERTKEDNAQGIDNSSGVAKAYDFERVNGLLAAKADSMESIENRLADLVSKFGSEKLSDPKPVSYPDDFDVRGLHDEFEIAARLALIEAPDGMRRQQMEAVVDKLFPKLKKDLRDKLLAELEDWSPSVIPVPGEDGLPPAGPKPAGKSGTSSIKAAGTQKLSAKLAAG